MATAAQHVHRSSPRALVVDDSQIARFVLRDLLKRRELVTQIETATRRAVASAAAPVGHNADARSKARRRPGRNMARAAVWLLALVTGLTLGLTSHAGELRGLQAALGLATDVHQVEPDR